MLKRTCVQCGKEFEMSQSEISFYKKKKLSLPKRCKECRELNKSQKKDKTSGQDKNTGYAKKAETSEKTVESKKKDTQSGKQTSSISGNSQQADTTVNSGKGEKKVSANKKRLAYIAAAVIIAFGGGGTAISTLNNEPADEVKIEQTIESEEDELTDVVIEYEFRNDELFENHYKKHGIDMGFDSPEEYLAGANRVIASPDVLHKIEKEDGDDVYYLEASNEFVVVSKDGYLRTYFNPSDGLNYYNRQ